ncbi:MAG: formylglycine-generating enzyme family protein [Loktanella sp.]|jgi:formylglycine-generating enzyme required for sulfatase activity|nr:formylglycine-generating enzyme family protein [Yoonia sp.]MDO7557219.1 formylglycine-generating enzyme family protein [Loktanella sp.]MDO7607143.1 formylglycine-generating enzyme family protein [Loktanella sp.]MDO7621900.1 formylglycine-generating enzyme family protein [Loktanella sp.]MDO7624703.1 formylglycine-generating enzyme family protein [Loktanella sp.]
MTKCTTPSESLRTRLSALLILSLACSASGSAIAQDHYELSNGITVAPLEMFQECAACPEMIVLPLGDFIMGGPEDDTRYSMQMVDGKVAIVQRGNPFETKDERPLHKVKMDMLIAMGRNEITYDQWMACVDDGGCGGYEPKGTVLWITPDREVLEVPNVGKHPVTDVSYLDAVSYADWLNEKVGADVYRIPTEAEWEYAARGGTQTRFGQGDDVTTDQVNFNGQAEARMSGVPRPDLVFRAKPVEVDMVDAANNWGLRHMSGNVVEITSSCKTDHYFGWSTGSEWLEKSVAASCYRATRGGGYPFSLDLVRVASRGGAREDYRSEFGGFRVLRDFQ